MKAIPGMFKYDYHGLDVPAIKHSIANRLVYSVGKDPFTATPRDWFHTTAYVVRDRLIERWMETMRSYYHVDAKRIYYLSLEFLIGRTLRNSLANLDFYDECRQALEEVGLALEDIRAEEYDAALGNGGLGRLAACFLDSMATLRLPGYGYGIRYDYGMFTQRIVNGSQVEHPENWLRYGNPWEFPRPEVLYPVRFRGRVVRYEDEHGGIRHRWLDGEEVMAMAYDTPVPGYGSNTVNNLRLWTAKSSRDFDLQYFNQGNYIKAVESKNESENLARVLYPDDTTTMGRELRLKQEYFFVCASLQDILRRYLKHHKTFDELPNKVAIQLNDTHPSIAIPELMRILVDTYHLEWSQAWDLCVRTFSYTNHTLMPEALETWPVRLLEGLLPRHLQIIYEINHRFLREVRHRFPGDTDIVRRLSLIDEAGERRVRMAHLAIVGSHAVNGVAALHTRLMKERIFRDFESLTPGKIVNITNGITPRRWLLQANPRLARLISSHIGRNWITNLQELERLVPLAEDAEFCSEFDAVKRANKEQLAERIWRRVRVEVNVESIFDVQVKRIHEYKRQLLNVLHVVASYNAIRSNPAGSFTPRTVIISGKAAPGYFLAKLIIKLINDVAEVVNHDPVVGDRLKLLFLPDYNVSLAEEIMPAANLSQQISTAGTEASGTGNMKLALNGALTIGTLDGANVEIREAVGEQNIFIFGLTAEEVAGLSRDVYDPGRYFRDNPALRRVLDMIGEGHFASEAPGRFQPVLQALLGGGDRYLVLADFASYAECQQRVAQLYENPPAWTRRAVLNCARVGYFSSDRCIQQYAEQIWQAHPVSRD